MAIHLMTRNESRRKGLYRTDALKRLAQRVCSEEGLARSAEISLLLCDNPAIATLNRDYRHKNEPTDVLSFPQTTGVMNGPVLLLGDIVISLETVEERFNGDVQQMRAEVRLLFCHGLLHLLGYTHDTLDEQNQMAAKQAYYLGIPIEAAWGPVPTISKTRTAAKRGHR